MADPKNMGKILIVEDSPDLQLILRDLVVNEGYVVFTANNGAEALDVARSQVLDLVFLDIGLPDVSGIELIGALQHRIPDVDVVMLTAVNDARTAVDALKSGAIDYILKPFELLEFRKLLNRLMAARNSARQLRIDSREKGRGWELLGQSPVMVGLRQHIATAATVKAPVLICGETGTGKELVARALHSRSGAGVFVKVDCGTLSGSIIEAELFGYEKGAFTDARETRKGLVEVADGGILFLDEIGNLPLALQPKLLRLIEESVFRRVGGVHDIQVTVRIVAATNINIEEEIRQGRFREDLYYRLNVITLIPPPLRQRREDILLLADHYLRFYSAEMNKRLRGFTPETEETLLSYDFPGNVRELKNLIERAVIYSQGERLAVAGLGSRPGGEPSGAQVSKEFSTLKEMERRYIQQVLDASSQNKSQAARILGISRATLREKLGS
jgi:DNA-binding NtrC family response regulator